MPTPLPPETAHRGRTLPTEVLHRIVCYALAVYLDEVIVGHGALDLGWDDASSHDFEAVHSRETDVMVADMEQTGVCSAPVVQLLRVSYVVRHVTLEVVGKVFNLRYIRDGLGCIEGGRPWNMLSKCRHDVWEVRYAHLALPAPTDEAECPILAVYLAHNVLLSEIAAVWESVGSYTYTADQRARGLDRWNDDKLQRWATYALTSLDRCPDIVREGLVARLRDSVMQFRIADVFAVSTHDVGWLWRQTREWYEYAEEQGDPLARPLWAAGWSHGLQDSAALLLRLLRTTESLINTLIKEAETMPLTSSIDRLIGRTKYLALITPLAEVVHWEADGEVYDDCKTQAGTLLEIVSARHSALVLSGDHDADRPDGETDPKQNI